MLNSTTVLRSFQTLLGLSMAVVFVSYALGHGVAEGDASFLQSKQGLQFWPYAYLGTKHMVTGYDHLLFLGGVIFFVSQTVSYTHLTLPTKA